MTLYSSICLTKQGFQVMMTSQERLLAAYRREEVDRLPVYIWGLWPYLDEQGEIQLLANSLSGELLPALKEYVKEKSDLVAPWAVYHHFDYYCFGRAFDTARIVERDAESGNVLRGQPFDPRRNLFLPRIDQAATVAVIKEMVIDTPRGPLIEQRLALPSGRSEVTKHFLENDKDLERFQSMPYEAPAADLDHYFALRGTLGDKGLVRPHFVDAVYSVYRLMGSVNLAYWSVDKRSQIRELLDIFQERLLDSIRQCGETAGAPAAMMTGQWVCLPPLHSPRDFREFVLEYDREAIDLFHSYGMLVVTSSHSNQIQRVLDHFVEMGTDVLNGPIYHPWSDVTPKDLRQRLSPHMAIEGGVALADIYSLDRTGLEGRLRYALEASRDGRGLVLTMDASPLVGSVLDEKLADNFRAMLDFAQRACLSSIGH